MLATAGADLNARAWGEKSLQMTPLTWLVYGNHGDAVQALLEVGHAA